METLNSCVSLYTNRYSLDNVQCLWIDECHDVDEHKAEYRPLTRNAINRASMTNYTYDHPLYLIVYYSKLQKAVEWGWFYPLCLLKYEIYSLYTHRTITRTDCSQSPSKPFKPRQAFLKSIPFHPPTTELTLEECFHAFQHRYQIYMTLKTNTIPLHPDLLQVFTPTQLHADQQSFFVTRAISMCCLPLSVLTVFLQEMIEYEVSLFRYRIQTNWLPYTLTLWTLLLQELEIPYQVEHPSSSSSSSSSDLPRHHHWFKIPFEHVMVMAMKLDRGNKRYSFIYLKDGYVYANEAHVYRMLPYLYKRYLTQNFFERVIQQNAKLVSYLHTYRPEHQDFKERIGSAYPIIYEYLGHLNSLSIGNPSPTPSPSASSSVNFIVTLQQLHQYGPRCIQKMIQLVESKKHIQEWNRLLLYAAMITSRVHLPQFTEWMKTYSHHVYSKQGPGKLNEQLMEVDTKIKNRLKTPPHQTFTCTRYIQAGLCGCMDPRKTDDIEDIGATPQAFCSRLLLKQTSGKAMVPIHRPKDYIMGYKSST